MEKATDAPVLWGLLVLGFWFVGFGMEGGGIDVPDGVVAAES